MPKARYKSIVDDIAFRIQSGELCPGHQLPTIRAMMKTHRIAMATATRVYAELEASGLIVGEAGRGTFVRDASLPRSFGLQHQPTNLDCVDLTFSYPSLPGQVETLREGLRTLASTGDLDALLHSAPHGGRRHERQTLAKHLRNRGIRIGPEQVLIVNGAQQGLAVTAQVLFKPGDVIAVDALTYPGMMALARSLFLDIEPIPQSENGTNLDALTALCKRRPVRAVYAMPTMQNPLGTVMGHNDRVRLAALADQYKFWIIEDGAYAFLAEPAPKPVFTYAPHRTIYVSGLSKSVASGLRVGIVAAPLELIPSLEVAIRIATWNTPTITVALCCAWIESGVVDTLEEGKRKDARRRQKFASQKLRGCTIIAHPSSYYIWLKLPPPLRADQVAVELAAKGVLVTTAERFSATSVIPNALRLSIGSISMEALGSALNQVREVTAI